MKTPADAAGQRERARMVVGRSLGEIPHDAASVVTVGTFDGIHRGHQTLFAELTRRAAARSGRSIIMTFEPHPRSVIGKGPVGLLTTLDERLELIRPLGVDVVLVLEFTYAFSRQTSRQFIEEYIVRGVGAREVIVGYNHMFGRDRESGVHELRALGLEYGMTVDVVDPVSMYGMIISSSRIRELLAQGDVERAAGMLGRPYSIAGRIVEGDRRGSAIGFPTANIAPQNAEKVIPANGVYVVSIRLGEDRFYGMMNIGYRPTVTDASERTLEVHIFNFSETIYGRPLEIRFLKRLRSEQRFASVEELIAQLHRDRNESTQYIATITTSEK